ncbi:hypothetical protein ACJ41O_002958 [Fusarium nematophilum]
MRTQHHLTISVPIPGNLPPSVVIAALQTYIPLIRHHRAMTGFDEVPASQESIADDPFFPPWDDSVRAYQIRELVTLAPGLSKEVTYPAVFQAVPEGARTRATAPAGVVVRAEFTVRQQRRAGTPGPISPAGSDSTATGSTVTVEGEEYELREETLLEANSLLMPFITDALTRVHREICERIMEEIIKNYFGTGDDVTMT